MSFCCPARRHCDCDAATTQKIRHCLAGHACFPQTQYQLVSGLVNYGGAAPFHPVQKARTTHVKVFGHLVCDLIWIASGAHDDAFDDVFLCPACGREAPVEVQRSKPLSGAGQTLCGVAAGQCVGVDAEQLGAVALNLHPGPMTPVDIRDNCQMAESLTMGRLFCSGGLMLVPRNTSLGIRHWKTVPFCFNFSHPARLKVMNRGGSWLSR